MSLRFQAVQRCVPHLNDDEKCQLIEEIIDTCHDTSLLDHIIRKMPKLIKQKIAREHVLWLLEHIPNHSPARNLNIWNEINHTGKYLTFPLNATNVFVQKLLLLIYLIMIIIVCYVTMHITKKGILIGTGTP